MGLGSIFHHVGVLLILAASILLLITSISAPVVNRLSLLKVDLQNGDTIKFGSFGYCILGTEATNCTKSHIGYSPVPLLDSLGVGEYGSASKNTADALTNVMILHPIGSGLAFLAFLAALGASTIGSFISALIAAVAWLVTLVVLITDFVGWGIIWRKVNNDDDNKLGVAGNRASFEEGIWTVLAAFVTLFFGTIIVLLACCSARRKRRSAAAAKAEPVAAEKKHFWQRKA